MATDDRVFIVVKGYSDFFMEVERVFLEEENAHDYVTDTYPYFQYYSEFDFYALPDLAEDELKDEEKYYVLERPICD